MQERTLDFDVALSFAGEDRHLADALAKDLKLHGVRVFYDEFFKGSLWGKDLYQHLSEIYQNKANYCVVFVSEHYARKNWTKHELKNAQSRAIISDREYILPIKLDETDLPGLNHTIGYIKFENSSIEEITSLLLNKLKSKTQDNDEDRWSGEFVEYNGTAVAAGWPKRIEAAQYNSVLLVERGYKRIRYGDEKGLKDKRAYAMRHPICHDCAVRIGQFHVDGCDMEQCPSCGGQAITCDCRHTDMTEEQYEKWLDGEE